MKITLRAAVVVLTVLGCVGCDQVTKSVARHYLPSPAPRSLFGGVVRLQHAENPGAFLSLGDSLPKRTRLAVFTLGGAALVIGAGYWAFRSRRLSSIQIVGAALVCGGGLSNLIDRMLQDGNVTDFLNIGVGRYAPESSIVPTWRSCWAWPYWSPAIRSRAGYRRADSRR